MWTSHALADDERLNRDDAKKVMRRAFKMLRPYRAEVIVAVLVMVGWTAASLGGPFLIRYGIDKGLNPKHFHAAALDRAAIGYACVAVAALLLARLQILHVTRVGEKSSCFR